MTDFRGCVTDDRLDNAISGQNDTGLNGSDTVTISWQSNDCGTASLPRVTTIYSIQTGADGRSRTFQKR